VWPYAGVNTFRAGRLDDLKGHPTVKPVVLVADAMRDCSRRGDIVLDAFAGSGTTIVAAEQIGRRAYCIELDPAYADVCIRRWQATRNVTPSSTARARFSTSSRLHARTVPHRRKSASCRKPFKRRSGTGDYASDETTNPPHAKGVGNEQQEKGNRQRQSEGPERAATRAGLA
jgi:hypothetical protein